MNHGGARVRSGPARDPNSIRSAKDQVGWDQLPASGRVGDPPPFPLPRPTVWESERWTIEWRKPQAIMWERLGLEVLVALYVRALRDASKGSQSANRQTNLMRQMDNLGLSPAGLEHYRWRIVEDAASTPAVPRRPVSTSAKDRLGVIRGGRDARSA